MLVATPVFRTITNNITLSINGAIGSLHHEFSLAIAKGTAEEIQNNDAVIEAYLGKDEPGEAANA